MRSVLDSSENQVTGAIKSNEVLFERTLLHRKPGIWELVDKFSGQGIHTFEWFFHFAPGLDLHSGWTRYNQGSQRRRLHY